MDHDFEKLMVNKSDEDLQIYITNSGRYKREAVEAAINELRKRGQTFEDEQVTKI
jgi:hypothetical protein